MCENPSSAATPLALAPRRSRSSISTLSAYVSRERGDVLALGGAALASTLVTWPPFRPRHRGTPAARHQSVTAVWPTPSDPAASLALAPASTAATAIFLTSREYISTPLRGGAIIARIRRW